MIVLFTDFGLHGPYTGQMKAVLHQTAPGVPVIDLFADAPVRNPKAAAYLLPAYAGWFPAGTVFLCVVDPGVGGARPALVVEADERWYVGPGNGLFELIQRRAGATRSWDIEWRPERLSASFHGRDLFAPVAAMLARGEPPPGPLRQDGADRRANWPDDLGEIVYIDHFGNGMTGMRAAMLVRDGRLAAAGRGVGGAGAFSDLAAGGRVGCWSVRGPSAICRREGRSGMRTRTGLRRSLLIRGERTTNSVSRSAYR